MRWLDIKFYPEFKEPMLSGRKIATARTNRHGAEVGDRFRRFGAVFEITNVRRQTAELISENYWHEEGFESQAAFRHKWRRIHPSLPWDRKVWHLWFKRLDSAAERAR